MNVNFMDYKYEKFLFELSLYRKLPISINKFVSKITKVPWNHQYKMNFHDTHYSEGFQHS